MFSSVCAGAWKALDWTEVEEITPEILLTPFWAAQCNSYALCQPQGGNKLHPKSTKGISGVNV